MYKMHMRHTLTSYLHFYSCRKWPERLVKVITSELGITDCKCCYLQIV